ncbi:MAG TPA: acyltransferase [Candidatus Dormibacteraeota bacterium]|nr:acyltransferase [Candidatus Dormibacteraeota bacterium]
MLRAVAVLGVLAIHAGSWPATATHEQQSVWRAVVTLARFSVPAFVVLTGIVLEYNRRLGVRTGDFLRRRAARSIVPWLAWAPLYAMFGMVVTGEIPRTPAGLASWLGYGGGHLYFLLLVPQLYLAFLVWPRGLRGQAVAAVLAGSLQTALCTWRLTGHVPDGTAEQLVGWHGAQGAPFWIGYFAVGVVVGHVARRRARGPSRPSRGAAGLDAVVLGGAAALVVIGGWLLLRGEPFGATGMVPFGRGTGAFLRPSLPVLVAGIVVLALWSGGRIAAGSSPVRAAVRGAVDRLSRDAMGIYVVQAAVLYPVGRLLFRWLESPSLPVTVCAFAVLAAAGLGASIAVTEALARSRLRVVVGVG